MSKTMNMIVHMVLATALVLGTSWNGQGESQDERSTELLAKVTSHYSAYRTMKVEFTVSLDDARSDSKSSFTGSLQLKGSKFRMKMNGQELFCDSSTLWTYLEEANEVTISHYKEDEMEISPRNIFRLHEQGFLHRYAGQQTVAGQTLDVVELTPSDKRKPYFKISLYLKPDGSIYRFSAKMKSGVTTSYTVRTFKGNEIIPDSHFTFDPKNYPGVVEIDLR